MQKKKGGVGCVVKAIGVKEKLRTVFQINPATTRQLTFQQFLKQGWEGGGGI